MTARPQTTSFAAFQQRRFDLLVKSFLFVIGAEAKRHNVPAPFLRSVAPKLRALWSSFRSQLKNTSEQQAVLNELPPEFAELLAEIGHPHA